MKVSKKYQAYLLFPLALFYWGVIYWRNLFYQFGFFVSHKLPCKVISIGNITTGGTGLTGRDITPETIKEIADKEIPGFGELFRELSYKTIGTSAMQSRACAVLANGKYIFALPGSSGGVTDAWDGILKYQLDINHKPCNFVELFPRLKEK